MADDLVQSDLQKSSEVSNDENMYTGSLGHLIRAPCRQTDDLRGRSLWVYLLHQFEITHTHTQT